MLLQTATLKSTWRLSLKKVRSKPPRKRLEWSPSRKSIQSLSASTRTLSYWQCALSIATLRSTRSSLVERVCKWQSITHSTPHSFPVPLTLQSTSLIMLLSLLWSPRLARLKFTLLQSKKVREGDVLDLLRWITLKPCMDLWPRRSTTEM